MDNVHVVDNRGWYIRYNHFDSIDPLVRPGLKVKTVFREERNGYILEKFLIDNEVDSWVPGYLAIPTNVEGKVPVIIGLHGRGSSKDNIF